ncbi:TrmB family transcriptional regulator [Clostridium saccharoperbutylacetonicum]|uniref:TrmB family transcriptional regulator n=1 Tax=Clostridium saccharoperbutylacetonicum TaxID=36745 RepID=UPI000983DCBA|nr:helix-turn-helix domain-containing protein [Clostridium saccharoperbutylacetonicum]AQR94611.1 sugar-specific transcriptional regulator TrmB [Clostridium saccharoperbutylacetonicum]NSB30450.1 sugar-specific transcriptional regulator TrmB [Clostridium saccharoperbutylacetonicum]
MLWNQVRKTYPNKWIVFDSLKQYEENNKLIIEDVAIIEVYEAKAYLALLEESPLIGYAVAKNSGVPRSKIYKVLDSLAMRGDILISHGSTQQYVPIPAKELIKNRRVKAEENFKLAEKSLEQYNQSAKNRENIWNITGHDEILDKVKECIISAKHRILIELWKEEFKELESELKKASDKGVVVTII